MAAAKCRYQRVRTGLGPREDLPVLWDRERTHLGGDAPPDGETGRRRIPGARHRNRRFGELQTQGASE
jgi:hypothetical protein